MHAFELIKRQGLDLSSGEYFECQFQKQQTNE